MGKGVEKKFSDSFVKTWQMVTGGGAYRIPDSYHITGHGASRKMFSHARPADYVVWCAGFSAFVEAKFKADKLKITPRTLLRPSQVDTIRHTHDSAMRYYLVFGTKDAAWAFDAHRLELDAQITLANTRPVGWFPHAGLHLPDGDNRIMLE